MSLQPVFDFDAPAPPARKAPAPKPEPVTPPVVVAPVAVEPPAPTVPAGLYMTRPRFAPVGPMPDLSAFYLFPRRKVETPSPEIALGALIRWQSHAVSMLESCRRRGEDDTYPLAMLACIEGQLLERYRWAYAYGIEDRHSTAVVALQRRESRR